MKIIYEVKIDKNTTEKIIENEKGIFKIIQYKNVINKIKL